VASLRVRSHQNGTIGPAARRPMAIPGCLRSSARDRTWAAAAAVSSLGTMGGPWWGWALAAFAASAHPGTSQGAILSPGEAGQSFAEWQLNMVHSALSRGQARASRASALSLAKPWPTMEPVEKRSAEVGAFLIFHLELLRIAPNTSQIRCCWASLRPSHIGSLIKRSDSDVVSERSPCARPKRIPAGEECSGT
jgi:hypothetical protein